METVPYLNRKRRVEHSIAVLDMNIMHTKPLITHVHDRAPHHSHQPTPTSDQNIQHVDSSM